MNELKLKVMRDYLHTLDHIQALLDKISYELENSKVKEYE